MAPEAEDAAEEVEDAVEVDSEGAKEGVEDDKGYLMKDLRDLMRDVCAGWDEANFGLLVDVAACAAETRQVIIREVEGGTGVGPIAREVKATGAVVKEWVVQAALQDGVPCTELAREVAEAGGVDVALLRDLRVLLVETLAGWGGMDSGPPVRAAAHAVEMRTVSIREVEGGTAVSNVLWSVKTEEVVTRKLDVQAVLEEESPE